MENIFIRLEDLLRAQKWKKADLETQQLLLTITGREKEKWLREVDVDDYELSPENLNTIDDLWLNYSNGRFGFSVQKRIYLEAKCNHKWNCSRWFKYCYKVGWLYDGLFLKANSITEKEIKYDISAPEGHLPWIWLYRNIWISNEQTTVTYPALMMREDLKVTH